MAPLMNLAWVQCARRGFDAPSGICALFDPKQGPAVHLASFTSRMTMSAKQAKPGRGITPPEETPRPSASELSAAERELRSLGQELAAALDGQLGHARRRQNQLVKGLFVGDVLRGQRTATQIEECHDIAGFKVSTEANPLPYPAGAGTEADGNSTLYVRFSSSPSWPGRAGRTPHRGDRD